MKKLKKKLNKKTDKILNILFNNSKQIKRLAKLTTDNRFNMTIDSKKDKSGVLHFIVKLDFPILKISKIK